MHSLLTGPHLNNAITDNDSRYDKWKEVDLLTTNTVKRQSQVVQFQFKIVENVRFTCDTRYARNIHWGSVLGSVGEEMTERRLLQ